jgi:hypothetical protein
LPTAGVKGKPTRFGRKRHAQESARSLIAWNHESRSDLEIATRLFFGPKCPPWQEPLKVKGVIAFDVADIAACMAGTLCEKNGLYASLEELVVQRRLRGESRHYGATERDRTHCAKTFQHEPLH